MGGPPKDVAINAVDDSIVCLTQPCGTLSDTVKHRLEISGRAGDHSQDFARSGLLFLSLSNFPRLRIDGLFQLRERVFGRRGTPFPKRSRSALSARLMRALFGSGFHKIEAQSPDQIAQAKISVYSADASKTRKGSQQLPCKTLAILLSGLTYKKDNGYLCGIIGVSGVVHPKTQVNDALSAFGAGRRACRPCIKQPAARRRTADRASEFNGGRNQFNPGRVDRL